MAAPATSSISDPFEIARRRLVLFSARVQYGPETQPIREHAIERLIEHDLLLADGTSGQTLAELYHQSERGGFRIHRADLAKALERLKFAGRVAECGAIRPIAYRLTQDALEQLWDNQRASERRLEKILRQLFRDCPNGWRFYEAAFVQCISLIFSELGEAYARLLQGGSRDDFLSRATISSAISEARTRYPKVDEEWLKVGVHSFFEKDDPDFIYLKWNLAQNYYVAKALGLDPAGSLLSEEILGGTELYMDTNVLISALTPIEIMHSNFVAVTQACKSIGIQLKFCQISLEELRHVVASQAESIRQMEGRIPADSTDKITNVFYSVYRDAGERGYEDPYSAFDDFYNPTPLLTGYSAERIDDGWFVTEAATISEDPIFKKVQDACTNRQKSDRVAGHDALLVKWVSRERASSGKRVWLLTRDRTLPKVISPSGSIALTLDALLQWIAPILRGNARIESFETLFSDAIRHQLLPQENFLEPRDFCLLLDMGLACEALPAADLEACIHHLKAVCPGLDPSDPRDREHLHNRIAKFFADPGRKYQQDLAALKTAKDQEINDLKAIVDDKNREAASQAETIARLAGQLRSRDDLAAHAALRKSTLLRLCIWFGVLLIVEILAAGVAYRIGTGSPVARISAAWPILVPLAGAVVTLSGIAIGRKRLSALGLPLSFFHLSGSDAE
jgi:hypothetical protein